MHAKSSRIFLSLPALALLAGALALALLGWLTPDGSALFFPLLSIWADLVLLWGVFQVLRVAKVQFKRFHWIVMGTVLLAALANTLWVLSRREFIYCWDYSNYLLKQYEAEQAFLSGSAQGLALLVRSLTQDYTSFITLFTEFPFCLTDRTGDSYTACQVLNIFPLLLLTLGGLVLKVGQLWQVRRCRAYFIIGLSWTAVFPFLRMSALLGQPDWFGLIFAFSILLLTVDFRFDRLEPARCALIFLATAALVLTRRWYLYFVVGYYFAYVLLLAAGWIRLWRSGARKQAALQARNLVLFGAISMAAMLALLWPIVRHILTYDYAEHYAAYNAGGLASELYYQSFRLGLLNLILIGLGLWASWKKKRFALPGLALLELAVSLVLFTRVQNMGSHQTLLLMPGYFLLFLMGAAALTEHLERRRALKMGYWIFTLLFSLSVRISPMTTVALPEPVLQWIQIPFTQLDEMTSNRTDADQIRQLAHWIDQNCGEGEYAYMIPHTMTYNPDLFKNCELPERPLENKLCFGFGILGTHSFPAEIFGAKYVITAEPFPWCYDVSLVAETLNEQFLALKDEYFAYETSFDMGNGTVFTIYRRTRAADKAEAEAYLAAFAAEDAQFPELYSQVIWNWCSAQGLE